MTSSTAGPVVIIGSRADEHVEGVARRVRLLGAEPMVLEPDQFPASLRITLGEALGDVVVAGQPLRPASVYVRNMGAGAQRAQRSADTDSAAKRFQDWLIDRECQHAFSAMLSRWEHIGVPVYNGLDSSIRMTKPFQLALLHHAGLPVPTSRWTNDPDAVRSLFANGRVAYKPVTGGAETRELIEEDMDPARLDQLRCSPVTFQGLLPGEDIRVYVLHGEVIAAIRIVANALDFRGHEQSCESIELPAEVSEQCIRAANVIGLRFTGMDLKRDTSGTLRFLELNCSPMFLGFDKWAGTDIAGCLAERLVKWQREPAKCSADDVSGPTKPVSVDNPPPAPQGR